MIKRSSRTLVLTALILVQPMTASAQETSVEQLLESLEKQMQLSQERYEAIKPELKKELEQKSREFSRSMDTALAQGLTELERLSKEYEAASQASAEKLQQFLQSEEVTEFREYLAGLDREAIEQARDELVAEFVRLLELSADQLEALKPLIREKLQNLEDLLRRYMDQGKQDFEQFRVEFEAERERNAAAFAEVLDAQQLEKFETALDSIRETIRTEAFEV